MCEVLSFGGVVLGNEGAGPGGISRGSTKIHSSLCVCESRVGKNKSGGERERRREREKVIGTKETKNEKQICKLASFPL